MHYTEYHLPKSLLIILLIIFSVLQFGCAVEKVDDTAKVDDYETVWPGPPDKPKYQYIMTIRGSKDIAAEKKDDLKQLLTGEKKRNIKLQEPFDVAARKGLLLITDRRKHIVHAFDIPRRRYYSLGYRMEGKLQQPLGIAIDEKQNIYVIDAAKKQLFVYDSLGLFQRAIGEDENFVKPTAVAVSNNGEQIAIIDTGGIDSEQHRLVVFNNLGTKLFETGSRGSLPGKFNLPVGVTFDNQDNIYVLDAGNFRVQVFDRQGNYKFSWGQVGRQIGQFSRPKSIASDNENNIYVSDAFFANVQVFNNQGELLLAIGKAGKIDLPGRYALPAGITVDEKGFVYILDSIFNKLDIMKYLPDSN